MVLYLSKQIENFYFELEAVHLKYTLCVISNFLKIINHHLQNYWFKQFVLNIYNYHRSYYYPYFIDKETELEKRSWNLQKKLQLLSGELRIWRWTVCFQILYSYRNIVRTMYCTPQRKSKVCNSTFHSPSFLQSSNTVVFISV